MCKCRMRPEAVTSGNRVRFESKFFQRETQKNPSEEVLVEVNPTKALEEEARASLEKISTKESNLLRLS